MNVSRATGSVDVAIVGAGPYGLSVAAHLAHARVETAIYGKPMAGWSDHMPKGMFLKSTFDASSLSAPESGSTLTAYCRARGRLDLDERHPVPLDLFVEYGSWFQERYIKELTRLEVRRVSAAAEGFRVLLSDGKEVAARTVIVATGHVDYAYVPWELQDFVEREPAIAERVSHACRHNDLSRYAGQSVAVIGGGQSALESAVLLHEAGARVHLLVRRSRLVWGNPPVNSGSSLFQTLVKPASPLGPGWSHFILSRAPQAVSYLPDSSRLFLMRRVLGPSGGWWLRDRFKPEIEVGLGTVVERLALSGDQIALQIRAREGSRSTLKVDHVIAATGYRINLDALRYLDPALRAAIVRIDGTAAPRLSRSFESSARGLYFTGLAAAPTFGPLMRFVCGTEFTGRTIRRAISNCAKSRVREAQAGAQWGAQMGNG